MSLSIAERLDLLLEFSASLPELPSKYSDHPDLLERVEECQAPVFLFVDIEDDQAVRLHFSVPREAPTTRGFASVLHTALDGATANEVLAVDPAFPEQLGLTAAISPLRMNGMRAMLARIKRQVREKSL